MVRTGAKGVKSEDLSFYQKIFNRFLLFGFILTLVLTFAVVFYLYKDYYSTVDMSAKASMQRLSRMIFQNLYAAMNYGGSEHVYKALDNAKNEEYIYSLDLYASKKIAALFGENNNLPPTEDIKKIFENGDNLFETYATFNERLARFVQPFHADDACLQCHTNVQIGEVLGVMDLRISLADYDDLSDKSIIQVISLILGLVFLASLVALFYSKKLIFNPLMELETATKKLAKNANDPTVRLGSWGKNEFGVVANNFNRYIESVHEINRRLEREEERTKELLETREEEIERRTAEVHRLNKKLGHYVSVVDQNVITSQTNLKGLITDVSSAFCQSTGYSREELIGKAHNIVRHPDMEGKIFADLWDTIKQGKTWQGELKNRKKNGGFFWARTVISPLFSDNGAIDGYVAMRHDISLQKELEETLKKLGEVTKQSHTDNLTGLMNRLRINELLQMEIDRVERYGGDLSVALMDIDHFKKINDTYGHLVGDEVLKKLASVLTIKVRKTDLAGRWGGEEFLMVFTNTPKNNAFRKLDQLRGTIERENFAPVPKVTVSIGISAFQSGDTIESLTARADVALYLAKESGRNRVEVSPEPKHRSIEINLNEEK